MIEEQAYIISLSDQHALVEIKRQSSCNGCDAQSSCGTSSLSQLFGNRPSQFTLDLSSYPFKDVLKEGDVVMIGLEDINYLKASLLIYLLPLISLFCFALIAEQLFMLSDGFVVVFAAVGLWFGFKLANKNAQKNPKRLSPQFIKKV